MLFFFLLTSLPDWGVMKFVLAELDAGPLKVPGRVCNLSVATCN
jgi:hypothetical protein